MRSAAARARSAPLQGQKGANPLIMLQGMPGRASQGPIRVALAVLSLAATAALGEVEQLTDGSFSEKALGREQLLVVDFYAPWCAHCQKLAPELDAAASRLSGIVSFGKLDCTANAQAAERYGIQSYPTLLTFAPGSIAASEPEEFDTGDGTADDIVRAAVGALSKLVLQRTRDQKDSSVAAAGDDASAQKQTCTMHTDPESGVQVEMCPGGGPHKQTLPPQKTLPSVVDVAVVGAGPAGLGTAIALQEAGVANYIVLERASIGESFRRWPAEMQFVSPSFYSNPFKLPDLNAVNPHSSPAFVLNRGHPSGPEYAEYLEMLADYYQLPVHENQTVLDIAQAQRDLPSGSDGLLATFSGFELRTEGGATIFARFVVWAGGEYQYPKRPSFPGAEHGIHNSAVASWANLTSRVDSDQKSMVVVGGYESGMDAALNLLDAGVENVFVFDKHAHWAAREGDASEILSPRTFERLDRAMSAQQQITKKATGSRSGSGGRLHFIKQHVVKVVDTSSVAAEEAEEAEEAGEAGEAGEVGGERARFEVHSEDGSVFRTDAAPILGTGFKGNSSVIAGLFGWDEDTAYPTLTGNDESVKTPGVFLVGPSVRHESKKDYFIFCFIYKFRARFPVVARAIAERLGRNHKGLEDWRVHNMFMDELEPSAACACSGKKS